MNIWILIRTDENDSFTTIRGYTSKNAAAAHAAVLANEHAKHEKIKAEKWTYNDVTYEYKFPDGVTFDIEELSLDDDGPTEI